MQLHSWKRLAIDADIKVTHPSGRHAIKKEEDTKALVKDMITKDNFNFTPGRHYERLGNFNRDVLSRLDITKLASWIKNQRKELMKEHLY